MAKYEIWMEGYLCTGMEGMPEQARLIGIQEAPSFRIACEIFCKDDEYFNKKQLTIWGCRLFDNENEARNGFG